MNHAFKKKLPYLLVIEIIILVLIMSFGLSAQDNEWSLKRCLEYAIDNNLDIQRAQLDINQAAINTTENKNQRYPNLSLGTNFSINFGRAVDPTTNDFITQNFLSNGFQVNSNMLIYNAGRITNTIKQSETLEQVQQENLNSITVDMAFNIAQSFINALLAQENVENLKVQITNAQAEIDRMNKMIEAGTRALVEIYDLEAQLATAEQDLAFAQNNYDIALVNLKSLMNIQFDTEMALVAPSMDQILYSNPDELTLAEAFQRALDFSPSNKAQNLRIEAAEYNLAVSKSGLYPSISAGANMNTNYSNQAKQVTDFTTETVSQTVQINGSPSTISSDQVRPIFTNTPYGTQLDENLFYGVGVGVNVPIFNNYQAKGSIERAKVNLEIEKNNLLANENSLRNTIQQLLTDARGAKRVLEASEKTLKAREIAAQNAEKRFEVGALNSYDYINIKNQYNQAVINMSIARYDYLYKMKILDYYQGYPIQF